MDERTPQPGRLNGAVYAWERITLSARKRDELYESILESSLLKTEYLAMLALAGLIALFGLLQNSVAVIIGAMLISPLMNPILSAALALLLGDGSLGRKSAVILGLSVGGVIAITCVVAWLSPLKQATPEILARTNPNLLDLFIAFLSGLAGTLALRGSSASLTIIPGVAIAVAVVPPLAVVGYGLSTRQWSLAGGAFLLFVTNLVSIIISAALVFRLMGFRPHEEAKEGRSNLVYRMALSAGILIVLSIPLLQTLRQAVGQIALRGEIEGTLNAAFRTSHSSVSEMSFTQAGRALRVHATLRTTRYFETQQINVAENSLRRRFGPDTKLETDQILVTQGGISPEEAARTGNAVSGGVVRPVPKEPPFSFELASGQILADLQKQLDEMLTGTGFQRAGGASVELSAAPPLSVNVRLASAEPIDTQTVALLSSQLSSRLSAAVQLHGQVRLSGPGYESTVEIPESRRGLALEERQKLAQLAKLVAQRPDLQLDITYLPSSAGAAKTVSPPLLLPEIQRVFSAAGLKPSRWNIHAPSETASASAEAAPSAASAANPTTGSAAGAPKVLGAGVRYEFQTYQTF